MKVSNTLANIAAMKQLEREILLVTRRQRMRELNTLVNFASMKQLERQCMKDLNTLANIAAMTQLDGYRNCLKIGSWSDIRWYLPKRKFV